MDLMALSIFFAAFVICSLLVFFISFYGTKEVTFEENLKASHGVKKSSKGDGKKKAKKGTKGPETSEIIPNNKVSQKRFKSRKKKATDQVILDQQNVEPTEETIEEPVEDHEIVPDNISETESTKNELVTADVIEEEIPVEDIVQEEVEKPVEEPKRPETPVEVPQEEPEVEAEPEEEKLEQPPVVEEVKQQSSAEATPKKSKKKQNKIKIEEVDAVVEEPAPEVIEPVEAPEPVPVEVVKKVQQPPKKEGKKKQKSNNAKDELILQPKTTLEDLINLVMKTPLDDLEIQNVIDLLLTRQTGASSSNYHDDWIDASEKKNDTKNLQNQLAEKDTLLQEEMAKVKSITDKMAVLRVDLNGARNTTVQSQRYVNELEGQKKQLEQRLHSEVENHQRYVATLQSQIQYHATRAQGLQVSLENVQQQQATIDPSILSELEGLRNLQMTLESEKMALDAECGSLHARLNSKTEECQQLQQSVNKKTSELDEAMTNLNKASENFATLEKKNSSDSGHFEELKRVNQDLEAKVNELTSNCTQQKEELSRLASEESGSEELKSANQDLVAKVNELNSVCTSQKNELSRLSEQESGSEELKKVNQDLEAKVNELTSNCLKQKEELARLADENERISDQLASMAERPAAEGQESNGQESFNGNGDHHAPSEETPTEIKKTSELEQENPWQQKYLAISQEHEQISKEKDVILEKMHTVESDYKSQVSKLESDLEDQRAKNNELRSKNWKTVEALNSVEQNYQKLLKSNENQSDTKVLEAALRDAEVSQKDFLQRLFPSVTVAEAKTGQKHEDWLEEFAREAQKWIEEQAAKASKAATDAAAQINVASNDDNDAEDKLQKLEGQVEHYKTVLAETENMLNQLQASVENEESGWKSQFSKKEAQLENLQRQLEAVEAKNTAMEASLNSLNSVEEVN